MNLYLDPQNHPRIRIGIQLSVLKTIDCLIDTGFSGGVAVPETYRTSFRKKPVGYQEYELADGSRTTFALYTTVVTFQNRSKKVTIFFTGGTDGLVGIEFLMGWCWIVDLKHYSINAE